MQSFYDQPPLTLGRRPQSATLWLRAIASLIAIDVLSVFGGFGMAIVTRTWLIGGTEWHSLLLTLLPLYVLIAFNNHAYSPDNLERPLRAARRGLQAMGVAIVATVLLSFSFKASDNLPRIVAIFGFVLTSTLMFVSRYLFVRHFEKIIGGNPFKVIVICDGEIPVALDRYVTIRADQSGFDPDSHDPLMYDRFAKVLQGADRVVIACSVTRRAAWARALKGVSVQSEIIVQELSILAPLGMDFYHDMPTMVVSSGPLGLVDRVIKRGFDILIVVGLIPLFVPLFFIVAVAIKLDSPGPVLFRQTRIGRDNKMFQVLKFRSMRTEMADSTGHRSATRCDDRITRIGRVIRFTSIDELPQVFNVLKGDMSVVGPRPHAIGSRAADKLFWEVDQRYWHRHSAKPGLTGLAQVRGFRGATLVEADLANRLHADLEYLENWTIWRDFKIILMTFQVIIHRNAY